MFDFSKLGQFYKGKKVLITGHTGFKGSWMCMVLESFGAQVSGYSLEPATNPSLFEMLNIKEHMHSYLGDIRNLDELLKVFEKEKPQIVIHMAAQPIVRASYEDPVGTYSTNVMGTVNLLECCRRIASVKSVVNVTTDKVYRNNEWERGYVENDFLDGYDPYSNSKSCSELVTHSYIQSFLEALDIRVSTCRAGNVLGGGDFSRDRIIPDCVRAAEGREDIVVRNPYSTRPYQHVLEPIFAYLMVACEQYRDNKYAGAYNVGPNDESNINTGHLADMFCALWNKKPLTDCEGGPVPELKWINKHDGGPHEAGFLKLDCGLIKKTFDWSGVWNIEQTMERVCDWYRAYLEGRDMREITINQIGDYLKCSKI